MNAAVREILRRLIQSSDGRDLLRLAEQGGGETGQAAGLILRGGRDE
jgi:hypothetical protein